MRFFRMGEEGGEQKSRFLQERAGAWLQSKFVYRIYV